VAEPVLQPDRAGWSYYDDPADYEAAVRTPFQTHDGTTFLFPAFDMDGFWVLLAGLGSLGQATTGPAALSQGGPPDTDRSGADGPGSGMAALQGVGSLRVPRVVLDGPDLYAHGRYVAAGISVLSAAAQYRMRANGAAVRDYTLGGAVLLRALPAAYRPAAGPVIFSRTEAAGPASLECQEVMQVILTLTPGRAMRYVTLRGPEVWRVDATGQFVELTDQDEQAYAGIDSAVRATLQQGDAVDLVSPHDDQIGVIVTTDRLIAPFVLPPLVSYGRSLQPTRVTSGAASAANYLESGTAASLPRLA
jgi:hypothetical protein